MYSILKFEKASDSLKKIITFYNIKEIFIPYYLCSSVRHAIFECDCKPIFYHIDDNFMPDCIFTPFSYILYPNYFGICENNVKLLSEIYPNLIVDNAHAFFANPSGFACFNAGYKFNLENCSYLWIKNHPETNIEVPDFTKEKNNRKQMFLKLHEKYFDKNKLIIDTNSVPFCYPFLADTNEEADNLVKVLTKQKTVIYRYWEALPQTFNEYKFYRRLVCIPLCDKELA